MTPKQLEKLKPGALLLIGDEAKKYWDQYAYEDCSIKFEKGCMLATQEHAIEFLIRKCIAHGMKYTASFKHYLPDVGEGKPGARIEISVGGFKDATILSHDQLTLYAPKFVRNYKTHRHITKEA